jgi:hypothetical protein
MRCLIRNRDRLGDLCPRLQQAFLFLQLARKWLVAGKPLVYSCWILIFLALLRYRIRRETGLLAGGDRIRANLVLELILRLEAEDGRQISSTRTRFAASAAATIDA